MNPDNTRPQDSAVPGAQRRSRRVLLVDDDHDAAETLSALLALDGHTVRTADNGPAAVAEAEQFDAEYILMDIGLPGFSGLEATRRIRQLAAATRPVIIALTGRGSRADQQQAMAAGCDRHLVKPVRYSEIQAEIQARILAAPPPRPSTEQQE